MHVHFGVADVLVPFASDWRSSTVAWGMIAAWLLVAVEVTSLQVRRLPKKAWRAIHLSSYLAAVLSTVHGFAAGTDTRSGAFAWAVVAATGAMAFFTAYRWMASAKTARAARIPTGRPPAEATPAATSTATSDPAAA